MAGGAAGAGSVGERAIIGEPHPGAGIGAETPLHSPTSKRGYPPPACSRASQQGPSRAVALRSPQYATAGWNPAVWLCRAKQRLSRDRRGRRSMQGSHLKRLSPAPLTTIGASLLLIPRQSPHAASHSLLLHTQRPIGTCPIANPLGLTATIALTRQSEPRRTHEGEGCHVDRTLSRQVLQSARTSSPVSETPIGVSDCHPAGEHSGRCLLTRRGGRSKTSRTTPAPA